MWPVICVIKILCGEFCFDLIKSPRVVEFKMILKIMSDEPQKIDTEIPQSDYKNLIRKISNRFEELQFVQKSPNNVLVYPSTINPIMPGFHQIVTES